MRAPVLVAVLAAVCTALEDGQSEAPDQFGTSGAHDHARDFAGPAMSAEQMQKEVTKIKYTAVILVFAILVIVNAIKV
jgi:hypothetical protein